jgi:ABC-type Zn2+ transport system substrate-binding protein/surface adhesin
VTSDDDDDDDNDDDDDGNDDDDHDDDDHHHHQHRGGGGGGDFGGYQLKRALILRSRSIRVLVPTEVVTSMKQQMKQSQIGERTCVAMA